MASVKEYVQVLLAVGGVAFGMGGYASSYSTGTQISLQQQQIAELTKDLDKLVTVSERHSSEIDALLQWAIDHDKLTTIEKKNAASLKEGARLQREANKTEP